MRKFISLSPKESLGLEIPLYQNAIDLKSNAILIAETNKSYSCATSLLILSCEEVVKASLVLLHSQKYAVYKMPDAKKFFHDHKTRHHIAQLVEMGHGILESITTWEFQKENPLFSGKGTLKKIANKMFSGLKVAVTGLKALERIQKLQNFNDLKNNGLYVGYVDEISIPKVAITEQTYSETKEIIERFFSFYENLNELFNSPASSEKELQEKEKTKEDLRFFISKALGRFSFKELSKVKVKPLSN